MPLTIGMISAVAARWSSVRYCGSIHRWSALGYGTESLQFVSGLCHPYPESIIRSDGWRGYNGLVDVGYEKHLCVDHHWNEFVRGTSHINGIEGFWGFSKSRLTRFKGLPKVTFYLHLKECEFRFNYKDEDIYHFLLKIIRNNPLF